MGVFVAIAPIFDARAGRTYMPGHTFEMDDERAAKLVPDLARRKLVLERSRETAPEPAAADETEPEQEDEEPAPDMASLYSSMTNAQLAEIAKSRGLDVPRKPNKAQLLALLAGE